MTDSLRLHVTMDGQAMAFPLLSGSSASLPDDVDVFPRDLGLELALPRPEDHRHFQDILTREGWEAVTLAPTLDAGDLVYQAGDGQWLPAGQYRLRLSIAGLRDAKSVTVTIADGPGEVEQTVDFPKDTRRVTLTAQPTAWDALIQRLLFSPLSTIDGRAAADWIVDDTMTAQRRACALNLLAKLRTVPSVQNPVIGKIDSILSVQLERMYVRVAPDLASSSVMADENIFKREPGAPTAPIHQQLLTWIKTRQRPPEPTTVAFPLTSYRQAVTQHSLQVVFALPALNGPLPATAPGCYADLDIDLGGSLTDVVGFAIHMRELTGSGITDHLDLHARLANDRDSFTRNFLYYDVSRS